MWPATEEERKKAIAEVQQLHTEYRKYEHLVKMWNKLPKEQRTDLTALLDFLFKNDPR
jgi:hypothetical protein